MSGLAAIGALLMLAQLAAMALTGPSGPATSGALRPSMPVPWRPDRVARRRRSGSDEGRSMASVLPDLVDRVAVAASAGLSPASALQSVARHAPAPAAAPLERAAAQLRAGMPFDRCLDELALMLGPGAAGLVGALRDAAARGTPLAPALHVVGREVRDVRRRQVQVRARRLPVSLLFPLVLCTLPAAVLVTVVPVVVVALRSLSL